ncbi:MAG: addiction module HigA family antidote [Halioglobus sp.]|jgi:addiction module HigA family antidote
MITNPAPLHPGEVLSEVYMQEMFLNQTALAKLCQCSPRKINEIVNGKRGISPSFATVLESTIGTTVEICRPSMTYGGKMERRESLIGWRPKCS